MKLTAASIVPASTKDEVNDTLKKALILRLGL